MSNPEFMVVKRSGDVVAFDDGKIQNAIMKAFIAVEGDATKRSEKTQNLVVSLTKDVTDSLSRWFTSGVAVHIEDIQEKVELSLMRSGEHKVAKSYVLYRDKQAQLRSEEAQSEKEVVHSISAVLPNGEKVLLSFDYYRDLVVEACEGLEDVEPDLILDMATRDLYSGITVDGVLEVFLMASRVLIEREPNYSRVAARLLLERLRNSSLEMTGMDKVDSQEAMAKIYPAYFEAYIQKGVELGQLEPRLLEYDLKALGQALIPESDMSYTYLAMQTLFDRYFIHNNDVRYEMPQAHLMRVAMGLAINEDNRTEKSIEFYTLLQSKDYMSSTPTLFNSATPRPQMSSCYLTTVSDDLSGIYGSLHDNAMLSKFAGGLGNDWTNVRSLGAKIKGTNGKSQGVIPFLKVANDTAVAVNQGGKRKGAACAYLETWHLDIEEFLDLRKNTGDDRRRTHDMNTANWIPDLFMQRVVEEGTWTLFSPNDVSDLHDLYGEDFTKAYTAYEAMAKEGKIKLHKEVKAVDLWRKMLGMLFETGHPWITFKDPCNIRSPQQHVGVVHSSNLCTEITLNTSDDEIAVCNLGSVNLVKHIDENGKLDEAKLRKTVRTAIRMLDNVVDYNYYAVPQAKASNFKHRPIGLGIMGFQDALYKIGIPYGSEEAVEFADKSMELVSYFAIEASSDLAVERGAYASFKGSLWDKGILPIDSLNLLEDSRDEGFFICDKSQTLDWASLREKVQHQGMRNSNVMAIAPTATISNICGVSQSIEPTYQNLFVKSNLSGEFVVINEYLLRDLKALGLWDEVMISDLKFFDGNVSQISRIPDNLKAIYATAFEMDARWLIEAAARRQKWLDQAQSLNLYMAEPSGKKMDNLYKLAWVRGLKTTYYLRSMGATGAEKTQEASTPVEVEMEEVVEQTVSDDAFELGEGQEAPKACSILEPDCESCQ